ncbi:MAG: DUF2752 domain-containing protein [Geothrix sp.]|nr:DUF2752 domain-containing protein [Geothrix sp.]
MNPRWVRAPRVPRPPVWAAILAGFWVLLVLGGVLLESRGAPAQETCLLHRMTGQPCPTCGSTRVVLGFLSGGWAEAFLMNPLVASGLILGGLWFGIRLASGRTLHLELSPLERRVALVVGLGALLANWAWVLRHQA